MITSEAAADDDVIEVAGASSATGPGVARVPNRNYLGEQDFADKECILCPICQREWPADSITNAELNSHVDACLSSAVA